MNVFDEIFFEKLPIIVSIHLPALPGAPQYDETPVSEIANKAVRDVKMLHECGVNGITLDNEGDILYLKKVGPETIAAMAVIAKAVKDSVPQMHVGLNILQSDHIADIAVAKATGAEFFRAGYYTEAAIVDVGIMEGNGGETLRYRKNLNCTAKIFADVQIKHSYPLARRPLLDSVQYAYDRGLADAIIITGEKTGEAADVATVKSIREARSDIPLVIGSGTTEENIAEFAPYVDAVIIGTSLHVDGALHTDLDPKRVKAFMEKVQSIREKLE